MKIEVSERTFQRLQAIAKPFVDTVDDVIGRLIDLHDKKGGSKVTPIRSDAFPSAAIPEGLRGLQRELWDLVIEPMPTTRFTLQDVYARMQPLVKLRPHVQEIEASIRAALEKLRDKGLIEFIDNRGTYRRLT